ncbi:MAG TPA: acetate kinase [Verrucomicrobiota bacterium]|nr:acetate kinase [Verrucomicrobiota bacterium]HRR65063.1 acetate kinase [Candidatus Paceibacterota bacterium]HOF71227.1 acetate kinase [Verrucomicrobiota bacterium]HOM45766.1 acetate kinase [Verrucomicrobiota bacterium]HOQ56137.1 acetate kinase [Verrucomicrobiota bacterium]
MKILVLNSGSSSIKFQLREDHGGVVLSKGLIERIGEPLGAIIISTANGRKIRKELELPQHTVALQHFFELLPSPELQCLGSLKEIGAVGHRVVHGGEEYSDSVLIDDKAIATIDRLSSLAPLHNPPNLKGILACRELLPGVPQVAVFDTAFHQTMPPVAYMGALPRELYDKYKIRQYGFHGTSHRYVHQRARLLAGLEGQPSKIATAHLGNGCSITAIKDGKVIDTSMGFTPLGGLVMGTRPGDIDAALPCFLHDQGMECREIQHMLQKKSGLMGLSAGLSNDMRVLLEKSATNEYARLAVDVFCYRLKKYIGSYAAALGGLEVLAFTGGIGENAHPIRARACEGLEFLGIQIDPQRNAAGSGRETLISTDAARVKVYVIPTDEEYVIAEETLRLAGGNSRPAA